MMQLLAQLLGQQNSGGAAGTFNISYSVSGAGTAAANGTYYAMMSPDVKDQWGKPVYMNANGSAYLFASEHTGSDYTFKISSTRQTGGTDYYSWSGAAPQNISSQTVLSGGSAPFPTIQ